MKRLSEFEYCLSEKREKITLYVIDRKDDILTIKDYDKNREINIQNSIITDNEIIIDNNTFTVEKETYKAWFHPDVIKQTLENIKERQRLLLENIALLMENKNEILESKRYRNILATDRFQRINHQYMGDYAILNIGNIIQIWSNEPEFSSQCECGGKSYIYTIGGHYLTGPFVSYICVNCGNKWDCRPENYSKLSNIRAKYKNQEYIIYNFNVFKQMINKFKNKKIRLMEKGVQ